MSPENTTPLENLEHRIYETYEPPQGAQVPQYSSEVQPQAYGWKPPPPPLPTPKHRMSWAAKFLIIAVLFLVIAGGVAGFIIFQGTRAVSTDRVQISVPPLTSIVSGDTVSLVITIHNGNPAILTNANLFATLPDGTRTGDGQDAPLTQYTDSLGTISAGGDVTRTVQVKLYGTEGEVLHIPMRIEYRTPGSNALYSAQKDYTTTISTSPISIQVQSIAQTSSGQPFTITAVVRSNAVSTVNGVAVVAEYPQGFTVKTTNPALSGRNYFLLGTLAPGEQKTITVTGTLVGLNADQKTFRFTAGSANPDGTSTLGNNFAEGDSTVSITRPFLNVGVSLNGQSTDPLSVAPGTSVGTLITWQNTLTTALTNASITVGLSGNALDTATINGGTGFYRSSDSSIVFDNSTDQSLASLPAGAMGVGSFTFGVKSAAALAAIKNPSVTLTVSVAGQQDSQDASSKVLHSTITRTITVGTAVTVAASTTRKSGVDTGPVPPKAGSESTYTIVLTAHNGVNSVGAAKETFTIPSYVRYTNVADSTISYNADARTVTWAVGDLAPNGTATASLQVALTPSTSQKNSNAVLIQDQTFTGVDRFTQLPVGATAPAVTTELQGDTHSGTVQ